VLVALTLVSRVRKKIYTKRDRAHLFIYFAAHTSCKDVAPLKERTRAQFISAAANNESDCVCLCVLVVKCERERESYFIPFLHARCAIVSALWHVNTKHNSEALDLNRTGNEKVIDARRATCARKEADQIIFSLSH
jgi:hypothetical protein